MKKPDEMTLEECRGELAAVRGWKLRTPGEQYTGWWVNDDWKQSPVNGASHPVPATLDAIAGCMPEGWMLIISRGAVVGDDWHAQADKDAPGYETCVGQADTEILARARLAVAAIRATTKE